MLHTVYTYKEYKIYNINIIFFVYFADVHHKDAVTLKTALLRFS